MVKCMLLLLQLLCLITGLIACTYDSKKQQFCRINSWQKHLNWIHRVLSPFVALLLVFGAYLTVSLEKGNGYETLDNIIMIYTLGKKIVILFAITLLHGYTNRLEKIVPLLNEFARVYAQYQQLFALHLRLQWLPYALVLVKTFAVELTYFCATTDQLSTLLFEVLFSLPELILYTACHVGLLYVHAFFRRSYACMRSGGWQQPTNWQDMEPLLRYYDDVLQLRAHCEPYLRLTLGPDLICDTLRLALIWRYTDDLLMLLPAIAFIIFPVVLFTRLTQELRHIERGWCNELLQFNGNRQTASKDQLVQMFWLYSCSTFEGFYNDFSILYLDRGLLYFLFNFLCINVLLAYNLNVPTQQSEVQYDRLSNTTTS